MGLMQSNKKIFGEGNKFVNKILSGYVVVLLLLGCFVGLFGITKAGSPGEGVGWDDTSYEVTIGDEFQTIVWGDATEFSGYTMWNLTWTNETYSFTTVQTVESKNARFDVYTPLVIVSGADAQKIWNSLDLLLEYNGLYDVWSPYTVIGGTDAQEYGI